MTSSLPLVLASGSPRRRELLLALGLTVASAPADVDESRRGGESPGVHVLRVAREKAVAVAAHHREGPVLGADTTVVLGDELLGKPGDRDAARAMLRSLSGRTHLVLTAVCVLWAGRETDHLTAASVTFAPLSDEAIAWYLATGEGDDKAGAYAVQGRGGALIERVEGNVQAVIGLPLAPLPALFDRVGIAWSYDGGLVRLRAR